MTSEQVQERVSSVPFWWHSIQLNPEVVTPGFKSPDILARELEAIHLPDLRGKSVLDVGAWDGFFSFEAERRGAKQVVALDHYVWSMDIPLMTRYWKECQRQNVIPEQWDTVPGVWRPDELPGKRGFDTAREILGSHVECQVGDFMKMDLECFGTFDVVLYLGVLYHMHDPFEALKRVARVTRGLAVIETEAIVAPGFEKESLWEFYETNELNGDVNNWWAPTYEACIGICRAAGFRDAELLVPPPVRNAWRTGVKLLLGRKLRPIHYRATLHAWK